MKTFTLQQIADLINGTVVDGDPDLLIHDVVYLQNKLTQPHTLIFKRSETSSLNWGLLRKYAPFAIVVEDRDPTFIEEEDCAIIFVKDIEDAYYRFVEAYRNLFDIPVVAVTGTCGKTTTKEMIRHILQETMNVQATVKSNNSFHRNLSYLTGIDEHTDAAVFETAVGKPGQLSYHCDYFQPTIGIITNIGVDHLDGCKTWEAYLNAKAEILGGLKNQGVLIINDDCPNIKKIDMSQYQGRIVTTGLGKTAEFGAERIRYGEGGMHFVLRHQNRKYAAFVTGYGEHQVYNALAAVAAAVEIGVSVKAAIDRLASFQPVRLHTEMFTGINGCTVIDDTWSANMNSIEAALKVLRDLKKGRTSIFIISDITMLGDAVQEVHRQVGEMVTRYDVDILITVGEAASLIGTSALSVKPQMRVHIYKEPEPALELLTRILNERTIILMKSDMTDRQMPTVIKKIKLKKK
ncbi:Mur ligase family protein [Brevibacillus dissolubilis]|uniref:Mur ligase family protein n=1 Tax=Brevibacillus dissolubilis TaxID=1844116 RepID=UPI001116BB8E|nr:Mur ligase family protein [Brevibacillus dissolubilis]